eukprot:scaffold2636_cov340-Pavlova_lutheri.AAC.85
MATVKRRWTASDSGSFDEEGCMAIDSGVPRARGRRGVRRGTRTRRTGLDVAFRGGWEAQRARFQTRGRPADAFDVWKRSNDASGARDGVLDPPTDPFGPFTSVLHSSAPPTNAAPVPRPSAIAQGHVPVSLRPPNGEEAGPTSQRSDRELRLPPMRRFPRS